MTHEDRGRKARRARRYELTEEQGRLAAKNTGLIAQVLRTYYRDIRSGTDTWHEAFAEGMVGLCRAAATYREDTGWKFSTYGCVVVKRWLVNWKKKWRQNGFRGLHDRALEPVHLEPETWALRETKEVAPEGEEEVDLFTLGRLEGAVKKLGVRHQLVLRFLYQGGETTPQVAERMNVCRNRVQQLHQEALAKLREVCRAKAA